MKIKFKVIATFNEVTGKPMRFEARTDHFADKAEAQAALTTLPKSAGVRVGMSYSGDGVYYTLVTTADLQSRKGNDVNESGLKRVYSLLKVAECEMKSADVINCFQTIDEFIKALEVK